VSDDWSARSTVFTAGGGRHSRRSRRPAGLNNWRKHREDRAGLAATWKVDPFSTGVQFDGWKERANALTYMDYRDTYQPMFVYLPKTWLLYEGWRKHGLIGFGEVPSATHSDQLAKRTARERV
jgi:hypothetical protein